MIRYFLTLAFFLGLSPLSHAYQCYTLYDTKGTLLYRSTNPPFDISYPSLHATGHAIKGSQLIIAQTDYCTPYNLFERIAIQQSREEKKAASDSGKSALTKNSTVSEVQGDLLSEYNKYLENNEKISF